MDGGKWWSPSSFPFVNIWEIIIQLISSHKISGIVFFENWCYWYPRNLKTWFKLKQTFIIYIYMFFSGFWKETNITTKKNNSHQSWSTYNLTSASVGVCLYILDLRFLAFKLLSFQWPVLLLDIGPCIPAASSPRHPKGLVCVLYLGAVRLKKNVKVKCNMFKSLKKSLLPENSHVPCRCIFYKDSPLLVKNLPSGSSSIGRLGVQPPNKYLEWVSIVNSF